MPQNPVVPVRIGVVGLGRFGRLHALTLARLAEAQLVGLVARRQASLDRLSAELPSVRGWTSLEQAIEESDAEAWVVACSTAAHVPVTSTLLKAGKSVLLEKPVADSLREAKSLSPLVRTDSSNLMLGHIVLFNSEFQQLREEAARRAADCFHRLRVDIVQRTSSSSFPAKTRSSRPWCMIFTPHKHSWDGRNRSTSAPSFIARHSVRSILRWPSSSGTAALWRRSRLRI